MIRNRAARLLSRLKRDKPELAARVVAGELTAHAAAVQAGFRHKTITVHVDDPLAFITTGLKHFTRKQLQDALDIAQRMSRSPDSLLHT